MICIYDSKETNFNNNGLGILSDAIKCEVTELLNSNFELELEYPIDKRGKWQYILEGNVLKVPTPEGEQLFRICNKSKILNTIRCRARHIFYDFKDNFLEDVRPTSLSGAGALDWIFSHTQYSHNFNVLSDISTVNTAYYIRKNPIQALLSDDENSFINKWGGELVRDNFIIKMLQQRGNDRDVLISYGKNLIGIEEELDLDSVVTRIMPTGLNSDNTILMLPEKYIDSKYINSYSQPKIQEVPFQDVKVDENTTVEQAYELLRQKVSDLYLKQKVDIPHMNYRVSFIELSKTNEYKNYKVLESVYLGDTVTIRHTKLNIDLKARVIKYRYDSITGRYIEIELGDFKPNTSDQQRAISNLLNNMSQTIIANKSDMQKAVDNATKLLTTALGGYVVKRNGELLIMDTEDVNTAQKVWRWNINGLGYSSTGYNGNFPIAITMDGAIVADFITTGVLNAGLIKTGYLRSINNKTWLNMEDGTFDFADKVKWDGNNFSIDANSVKVAVGQIGGNNLIKNSNFFSTSSWVLNDSFYSNAGIYNCSSSDFRIDPGNNELHIWGTCNGSAQAFARAYQSLDSASLKRLLGKNIIFSHGTLLLDNVIISLRIQFWDSNWNIRGDYTINPGQLFKVPNDSSITIARVSIQANAKIYTSGTIFQTNIRELKLEEGENATAWSQNQNEMKGTNYEFTIDGFKIGSNASGNTAEHTASYSKYSHSDGSYTQISSDGLKRYIAGTGHNYNFFTKQGYTYCQSGQSITINLPEELRGKKKDDYVIDVRLSNPLTNELISGWEAAVDNVDDVNNKATFSLKITVYSFGATGDGAPMTYQGKKTDVGAGYIVYTITM